MKKNNLSAILRLIIPCLLAVFFFTFLSSQSIYFYIASQIMGAIFLAQCFILLHEFGHNSFFNSNILNSIFGYFVSFFVFIPFKNWREIHSLHHSWAGWRDKDPTTENTMAEQYSPKLQKIINFCWKYYIPVFTLGYRFGTYWGSAKLQKHLDKKSYSLCQWQKYIYSLIYLVLIILYPKDLLLSLPAILISFMITDIITLSQHAHIKMKTSKGETVKPLKPSLQAHYSRSLIFPKFFSEYFLFNINYHEAHHQYPGIPCYFLPTVKIQSTNSYLFFPWLKKVKSMPGIDFIFNSSKVRDNF